MKMRQVFSKLLYLLTLTPSSSKDIFRGISREKRENHETMDFSKDLETPESWPTFANIKLSGFSKEKNESDLQQGKSELEKLKRWEDPVEPVAVVFSWIIGVTFFGIAYMINMDLEELKGVPGKEDELWHRRRSTYWMWIVAISFFTASQFFSIYDLETSAFWFLFGLFGFGMFNYYEYSQCPQCWTETTSVALRSLEKIPPSLSVSLIPLNQGQDLKLMSSIKTLMTVLNPHHSRGNIPVSFPKIHLQKSRLRVYRSKGKGR